jgi:hypothetical protein
MGENSEVLTVDNKYGAKLSEERLMYFQKHVFLIIRLQAWARGVVTRE